MGPAAGPDDVERSLDPIGNGTLAVQPVVRRYTDCTIPSLTDIELLVLPPIKKPELW